ncbi:MAG TPA: alpha/beta fold hydrolase [Candidatus Binatia bacterium]|nr:alpha/beta fold hydrolase [Candidatus Binatia bacterium]
MPFLTHAGVSLRYDRAGSGPALLLVHGWLCNRTFWERQVHALRDRFTVITVDLRGHGESSRPAKGYGVGALAGDLEALVRALGIPRVAIVGWSLGGMVALELTRRLGERASALGLVGTSAGGLADPKNPLAQPKARAEMAPRIAADFRTFAREFTPGLFKAGAASPLLPWALAQTQKTAPHVAAACFEGVFDFDARPFLGTLRVPTAVLHGRADALFPLAHAEHLAKDVPGATLRVFEASGHSPHLEEPEAFNAALTELLAA